MVGQLSGGWAGLLLLVVLAVVAFRRDIVAGRSDREAGFATVTGTLSAFVGRIGSIPLTTLGLWVVVTGLRAFLFLNGLVEPQIANAEYDEQIAKLSASVRSPDQSAAAPDWFAENAPPNASVPVPVTDAVLGEQRQRDPKTEYHAIRGGVVPVLLIGLCALLTKQRDGSILGQFVREPILSIRRRLTAFTIARFGAVAMLFFAVGDWPSDYYTVARLVACLVGGYGAYRAVQRREQPCGIL